MHFAPVIKRTITFSLSCRKLLGHGTKRQDIDLNCLNDAQRGAIGVGYRASVAGLWYTFSGRLVRPD